MLPSVEELKPRNGSHGWGGGKGFAIFMSLLLHGVIAFAVFGDFNFFKKADRAEEIILQAVLLPDAKVITDNEPEKTEKRPPIPPPPPPPPSPPPPKAVEQPLPSPDVAPPEPESPPEEQVAEESKPLVDVPEDTPNSEELSRSILNSLEELEEQVPQGEDDETTRQPLSGVVEKLPLEAADKVVESPLTADEIGELRAALAQCWSVLAGARDAANLVVEIRIELLRDGSISRAEVIDSARMQSDAFFRVAAEDALRALYHPQCEKLPLPEDKYDTWKVLIFEFNASEMLG